jgi:hypothetical protein
MFFVVGAVMAREGAGTGLGCSATLGKSEKRGGRSGLEKAWETLAAG